MCLVGTMGVQAKITVVPPEESETGAYELTFSEGEAGEGEYANIAVLPDYVKNAKSLVIKTSTGYTLDTEEIEQIMGGNGIQTLFSNLVELDMGDAVLEHNEDLVNMKYAKIGFDATGLTKLEYFVFPKTTTGIHPDMFQNNTTIKEIILLEPDNESDPHMTGIGANVFQNCTSLEKVRIPNNITVIGPNAFQRCAFESIHLPNSLTTIGSAAFSDCKNLKSITIPASVTYIETSAFQHNTSMTDVYVIGNNVRIQDGAFNENETYNFKYQEDGDVDFSDWKTDVNDGTNTPHPLCLHIPNTPEAKSRYINLCLQVLNDPRMTDEVMMDLGTYGSYVIGIMQEYGIKDLGSIWYFQYNNGVPPYVVMDGKRYFKDGNGKFNATGDDVHDSPYGGWRNFMLVAADIDDVTWPDKRMIDSRWYSAVFPFDMSYNQLIAAYGNGTDVREFSYVNEYDENGKTVRTVTFNKVITGPRLGRGNRVDRDAPNYIQKGRPYMIHPGVRSVLVEVNGDSIYRTIAGVNVSEATTTVNNNTDLIEVKGNLIRNGNTSDVIAENAYYFKGTYKLGTIPANTFYLGYDPKHGYPLAFYVTRKDLSNKWTAFTSIVRKTNESGTSTAKMMGIDFTVIFADEENLGITTKIESVKNDRVESQKVYNLSGQVVRENNGSLQGLSKGVYVVNGKKVVVR